MPSSRAVVVTLLVALARPGSANEGTGLLCSNYAAACAAALSAFNCSSVVAAACGNSATGIPATLDNFVGTCTCLAPYYFDTPSGRLQEEIWDAAVKTSIGSLLQYLPNNSTQVDFAASVGNVCQTGLGWMGCPPGKALVDPTSTEAQQFQCLCGSGFDISTRAVEGVVDYLTAAYYARLPPPPVPLCADYPSACSTLMSAAGCPPASPVGGCADGADGDISTFEPNCTCVGLGAVYWDNGGGRLTELFIDDVLKPAVGGDLVPYAGGTKDAGPYNLSASYQSACASTLAALGCPAGDAVNPGTSTGADAAFECSCGSFDASDRVAEDTLDHVMAPVMAGIAAAAAAARATPGCPAASVPDAYIYAIGALGGALLLALVIAAGVAICACRRRASRDSSGTVDWIGAGTTLPSALRKV